MDTVDLGPLLIHGWWSDKHIALGFFMNSIHSPVNNSRFCCTTIEDDVTRPHCDYEMNNTQLQQQISYVVS
jgi:hypothetical protein